MDAKETIYAAEEKLERIKALVRIVPLGPVRPGSFCLKMTGRTVGSLLDWEADKIIAELIELIEKEDKRNSLGTGHIHY